MKKASILLLASLLSLITLAQSTPKVLIIGIDGCRHDAMTAANTPNLDALIANATYSYDAFTEAPTWSGVGWSGMLTGVWRDKHGVSDNSFSGSNFVQYPHIFNAIETCDASIVTASIVNWGPVNSNILDQVDHQSIVETDLLVRTESVDYLTNNDPDILFIHFDDVDHAGHAYGFLPTVSDYLQSIEDTDTHIGEVLNAVTNRPNYSDEEWLILVSTDHGGTSSGHGGGSFEERNIFVMVSGNSILNQEITKIETQKDFTQSLDFNGVDQYINLPDHTSYDFGTNKDFTIECMVKMNSIVGDPSIIGNKNWISGYNKGFVFSFVNNGPNWKVNIGDGIDRVDITGTAINDGAWHHLAVSFDRDGLMTMYQNGSLVEAKDMTAIDDIDVSFPIAIGQDGTLTYGDWFDGEIAEVKIWSTALNEETIIQNACLTPDASHPNISDLIGYWPINEGSGTTVNDLSNLSNNGTLTGAAATWFPNSGMITCSDYTNTPKVVDIAVTALDYLCGSIDPALNLDGSSLLNVVLPVELISFSASAKENNNEITWMVGIQENVKTYELQRSKDGKDDFRTIGNEKAILNKTNYLHVDQNPVDKAYYRLKIIDEDETFDYSDLAFVERKANLTSINNIRPNPASTQIRFTVNSIHTASINTPIKIIDLYGNVLISQNETLKKGQNEISINTKYLPSGLYYILLEKESANLVAKFIKE